MVNFGLSFFPTHLSISPVKVAVEAERLGFESLWIPEHSHIPVDTAFPLADEVPMMYRSMFDPFVSLAAAASVTTRLKLATGICLVTQRDPFNCAKEVATLDQLSGGRVIFGIGAGWNEPEMRNHGTDPASRFRLMRERVEAMKALWTQDVAEYHGRLVDFGPTWQWPKPVQRPHPPIILGGAGANVLQRVAAYGDGWLPAVTPVWNESLRGRMTALDDLEAQVLEVQDLAARAGRPRVSVTVPLLALERFGPERLAELGADRVNLGLGSVPEGEALEQLATLGEVVAKWNTAS
ncbi:MAG: LLM class F420-dependent oxidoreductase [Dehalococcoidia bacterium]